MFTFYVHELLGTKKKIALLAQDPTPDAKTKKLKYLDGKLHRLRSGD